MGILLRQREYAQARALIVCAGRASFYDTAAPLSPIPAGLLAGPFRLFPAGPKGPPPTPGGGGAGAPRRRGAALPGALGVVAAGEDGGDRTALPHLRPGVLRVFEQSLAE